LAYRKTPGTIARKNARRKTLLDAATRLFGRCGYHASTVPMIVAEADSSVGSFYLHFRNKEDVFAAVLEELGERVMDVVTQARAAQSDPLQQIRFAVESLFLFLAKHPHEARILIVESSSLSPRLERVRRSILKQHAVQVRHTLESAPTVFTTIPSAIAARCLVGAVFEALYSWLEESPNKRSSASKVARAVADYNARAIRR